jgi:hypothetical protein
MRIEKKQSYNPIVYKPSTGLRTWAPTILQLLQTYRRLFCSPFNFKYIFLTYNAKFEQIASSSFQFSAMVVSYFYNFYQRITVNEFT